MGKKGKFSSHTLPEMFTERLNELVGPSLYTTIHKTFIERPTTFRVNTLKATREEIITALREAHITVQQVPWYKDAFILRSHSKRELMELPIYTSGKIYIQSLASMVPPVVLDPKPHETVLDLTAAPGSKTSQIAGMMHATGTLVANDNNKVRFFKLKHNMELLGVADERPDWTFTLRMEHGAGLCREYPAFFDKILLDAPCSAEARFVEGDIKTYGYWSERKIKEMAYKQRQLLLSAWGALKPGGTLVYSTCTFAPEENEIQVARLLSRNADATLVPVRLDELKILSPVLSWKERSIEPPVKNAARILPTAQIEGFFVACIKKQ